MDEKTGLKKLGFLINLKPNSNGQNCLSILSKLIGREILLEEVDSFINSSNYMCEFIDEDGQITVENMSTGFRFKLPWKDIHGKDIYGHFTKNNYKYIDSNYIGVIWGGEKKPAKTINLRKYGYVDPRCWNKLKSICNIDITEATIGEYITSDIEYYNGAGYTKFSSGDIVTPDTGKFIKFSTDLQYNGKPIVGWFTKNIRGRYEGISWGNENDFTAAQDTRRQFYVGRMVFDSVDDCNLFLDKLKDITIPETWEYKQKKDGLYNNPILKSYLEFELDRLFYEQDILKYPDRIIINKKKDKILFNTNLLDKFGHDLFIVGSILEISNKLYVSNLEYTNSSLTLKKMGFGSSKVPMPPKFFNDINELIFHVEWDMDLELKSYEHIIEARRYRFPEKYQGLTADILGGKLDEAIKFARKIAQRNYKFIVPMYYPTAKRIQLLMPIFLETSYTTLPDFALVLTPNAKEKCYTLETILGLDEVYQDARLIAKPEESWLNPDMIK